MRVGVYIPYLVHIVLKYINVHQLHESIQQAPLISRNGLLIANPLCQGPPHHLM
jgi:hypothetical protein